MANRVLAPKPRRAACLPVCLVGEPAITRCQFRAAGRASTVSRVREARIRSVHDAGTCSIVVGGVAGHQGQQTDTASILFKLSDVHLALARHVRGQGAGTSQPAQPTSDKKLQAPLLCLLRWLIDLASFFGNQTCSHPIIILLHR
jgi:hypothetical protein